MQNTDDQSNIVLQLAGSQLASSDIRRRFVEQVNSKNAFSVLSLAHRLFIESKKGRTFNRYTLVSDIVPWNISQASAYRLVDDFITAGFIAKSPAGRIEATPKFYDEYSEYMTNMILVSHVYGIEMEMGALQQPDFWILRDTKVRFVMGGGSLEILGYDPEELIGTLPSYISENTIMDEILGRSADEHLLTYYDALWSKAVAPMISAPWAMRHKDGYPVYVALSSQAASVGGKPGAFACSRVIPESQWRSRVSEFQTWTRKIKK